METRVYEQLQLLFGPALKELSLENVPVLTFERPAERSHGDFATPIALELFGRLKAANQLDPSVRSPRELAEKIAASVVSHLTAESVVASVVVAGPGFINLTLQPSYFLSVTAALCSPERKLLTAPKSARSVLIEYISPNTNKPLHIGHLRNAALGIAAANLLERTGNSVHRAVVYNDRGLHIIKSEWAYLRFATVAQLHATDTPVLENTNWRTVIANWQAKSTNWATPAQMKELALQKPDHFVGHWYQQADQFVGSTEVETQWSEMLIAWEEESDPSHQAVRALWQQLNEWFYQGYGQTVARFGAVFESDFISYESLLYKAGKELVLAAAAAGTFTQLADGAITAELEAYKLPDKVLLRKDGTGIYMTFDIELTRQRAQKGIDQLIWVVGSDQKLYFQQQFAVSELLGLAKSNNLKHFAYGMVRLPEGKMSSRKGLVIYADDVLEGAVAQAKEIMQSGKSTNQFTPEEFAATAEAIGIGAVKWTMLSQDPASDITFNLTESVSFKGFAGPYIQYTNARTNSILEKAKKRGSAIDIDTSLALLMQEKTSFQSVELDTLKIITEYIDIFERSATELAPHTLCTYLYELCQQYNRLYSELLVLPPEGTEVTAEYKLRLLITQAVGTVLADGLSLLGITPVERM